MRWLNEPARWSQRDGVLTVTAEARTDFWRSTGYGFVRDNGHLYGQTRTGDFDLSLRVRGAYADQFDQAGAMLRVDETCWLKTGVEMFENRMRMSTVVTSGHSNWAIASLPPTAAELRLLVSRRGDAVEVRYAPDESELELAAIVYLPPDREVLAGAMCAAPDGSGFEASFRDLTISPR